MANEKRLTSLQMYKRTLTKHRNLIPAPVYDYCISVAETIAREEFLRGKIEGLQQSKDISAQTESETYEKLRVG